MKQARIESPKKKVIITKLEQTYIARERCDQNDKDLFKTTNTNIGT